MLQIRGGGIAKDKYFVILRHLSSREYFVIPSLRGISYFTNAFLITKQSLCYPGERGISVAVKFFNNHMKDYNYYIYIMASKTGVIYIGVTNNLLNRVDQHKRDIHEGFTKRYHCHSLVYYEHFSDVYCAIAREKELKGWRREKKVGLVNGLNKGWFDLFDDLYK